MITLLPTDTCYGLAGSFTREDYEGIYELKGRSMTKQLALLVKDFASMQNYIDITDEQIEFLKHYNYPWSFLGVRKATFNLPDWLEYEKYTMLSIRVAEVCLKLPEGEELKLDFPIFLTSANPSGQKEAHTFVAAKVYFPTVEGIDGGICDYPPSDIFSLTQDGEIQYLRQNYGRE